MGITPIELQQQEFKTVFRGYDPKEVEHILSVASRELETVMRQMNELRDINAQQQKSLENLGQREEELKRTLLMTQQVAHDMKVGARKEADLIMGRAELEAERQGRAAQTGAFRAQLDDIRAAKEEACRDAVDWADAVDDALPWRGAALDVDDNEDDIGPVVVAFAGLAGLATIALTAALLGGGEIPPY